MRRTALLASAVALLGTFTLLSPTPALAEEETVDFDRLWDFADPAATEARFRELLPELRAAGDPDRLAQLLSQIARTRGLQDDFDGAHRLLDEATSVLTEGGAPEDGEGRVRVLLERGRVWNTSGRKDEARVPFLDAFVRALRADLDVRTVDAVHMLAIVAEPREALSWNELAVVLAERARDERARRWLGSLYNNIGWTYADLGEHATALAWFEKALRWREGQGKPKEVRIARWAVARTLRSLGRLEEALALQQALLRETEDRPDGFVLEEVGECLWALDRREEARPFLARAHELLRSLDAHSRPPPERLASLEARGRGEEPQEAKTASGE